MLNLSLEQIFGYNAIQDGVNLVIQLSDLPRLNGTNPESIFVAIILKLLDAFHGFITDEFDNQITTENGTPLTFSNDDQFLKLNAFHWKRHYIDEMIRDDFILFIYQPDPAFSDTGIDLSKL